MRDLELENVRERAKKKPHANAAYKHSRMDCMAIPWRAVPNYHIEITYLLHIQWLTGACLHSRRARSALAFANINQEAGRVQ